MLRWLVVSLIVLLAGCTDAPAPEIEVESLVPVSEVTAEEPTYQFTILARSVEDRTQDVTFRLFVDGKIQRFIEWPEDDRSSDYTPVKRFEVPASIVSYDIVIDGNVVNGASMDVTECPDRKADTFVRIDDHWKARSDYGCHFPGYAPDE